MRKRFLRFSESLRESAVGSRCGPLRLCDLIQILFWVLVVVAPVNPHRKWLLAAEAKSDCKPESESPKKSQDCGNEQRPTRSEYSDAKQKFILKNLCAENPFQSMMFFNVCIRCFLIPITSNYIVLVNGWS